MTKICPAEPMWVVLEDDESQEPPQQVIQGYLRYPVELLVSDLLGKDKWEDYYDSH
jgi:hypothetical protein